MATWTREDLIEAAKRAAGESGVITLSRSDFRRLTGIKDYWIYMLFPDGGWNEVVNLAGLDVHPNFNAALTDEVILAEFHRVVSAAGRIPSWHAFRAQAHISPDTLRKRFGGRQGTIERYRAWLQENDPTSPILPTLNVPSRPGAKESVAHDHLNSKILHSVPAPARAGQYEFGGPLDFRELRHAPINEQGVVYLFGMVSRELGFLVEAI